ncbi:3',5'-cyclic-AMP phosphodiesterase 4D [Trichomycterus rosablanca]|uniref:3',5'-cyclic-AMP phosphodiesterase 4D n=1 Tax=Trichomycterus rosablanca TaxID=2290929 RepID=UPI002F35F76C
MMKENECTMEDGQESQVCDGSVGLSVADGGSAPESIYVRRLSYKNLQLPPLAFRLAEQNDWKETEPISRPTTLALRIPPTIAITSADSSRRKPEHPE